MRRLRGDIFYAKSEERMRPKSAGVLITNAVHLNVEKYYL